jgi:hypothetical protein
MTYEYPSPPPLPGAQYRAALQLGSSLHGTNTITPASSWSWEAQWAG